MGTFTPKPYRQFSRALGCWVWVKPEPKEFIEKQLWVPPLNERKKKGGRRA